MSSEQPEASGAAPRTTLAMSADFLTAFARLPKNQQRGVRTLITRFNADPTARGLNYEHIRGAADPNMRSLRIDQTCRAVVLKPERGDIHMLLWADKHDHAYQWAAAINATSTPRPVRCKSTHPKSGGRLTHRPGRTTHRPSRTTRRSRRTTHRPSREAPSPRRLFSAT